MAVVVEEVVEVVVEEVVEEVVVVVVVVVAVTVVDQAVVEARAVARHLAAMMMVNRAAAEAVEVVEAAAGRPAVGAAVAAQQLATPGLLLVLAVLLQLESWQRLCCAGH